MKKLFKSLLIIYLACIVVLTGFILYKHAKLEQQINVRKQEAYSMMADDNIIYNQVIRIAIDKDDLLVLDLVNKEVRLNDSILTQINSIDSQYIKLDNGLVLNSEIIPNLFFKNHLYHIRNTQGCISMERNDLSFMLEANSIDEYQSILNNNISSLLHKEVNIKLTSTPMFSIIGFDEALNNSLYDKHILIGFENVISIYNYDPNYNYNRQLTYFNRCLE